MLYRYHTAEYKLTDVVRFKVDVLSWAVACCFVASEFVTVLSLKTLVDVFIVYFEFHGNLLTSS